MIRLTRAIFSLVLCCGPLSAQVPSYFETMAPQRGIVPFGTYAVDKIEHINTTTGSLGLSLPIATLPPGRGGFTPSLDLVYTSNVYDVGYQTGNDASGNPEIQANLTQSPTGGWQYSFGYDLVVDTSPDPNIWKCNDPAYNPYAYKLSVVTPDRSHHTLRISGAFDDTQGDGYFTVGPAGYDACNVFHGGTLHYYTSDGTYMSLTMQPTGNFLAQKWTLFLPNGTQVQGTGRHATRIQDSNGNGVNITQIARDCLQYQCLGTDLTQTILQDDLNRSITISHSTTAFADQVQYPGNGQTLTATVNFKSIGTQGGYEVDNSHQQMVYLSGLIGIDTIRLPTVNGFTPTYTFGYAEGSPSTFGWGELNHITFPSGATADYTYALDGGQLRTYSNLGVNPVTKKTVAQTSPVTEKQEWTYQYSDFGSPRASCGSSTGASCTVITAPDSGQTRYDYISPNAPFFINRGLVFRTTWPDGATDETLWAFNRPRGSQGYDAANPYVRMSVHSVTPKGSTYSNPISGKAAVTLFTLDKNGNPLASRHYDWTSASSINHFPSGQLNCSTFPGFSASCPTLGNPLKTLTSVWVVTTAQTAQDGTESGIADDPNAYFGASGGPRRTDLVKNTSLQGSGPGSASSFEYDSNGNPKTEYRWDSAKSSSTLASFLAAPAASNAAVTARTFSQGNLITQTDPRGIVTVYGYDTSNLYLNCINQATTSTTCQNNGKRNFAMVRDQASGLLQSLTDSDNSVTVSHTYDLVGRLTSSTDTAGGAVQRSVWYGYNDLARRLVVAGDLAGHGDCGIVAATTFDQLGRPYLDRHLESNSTTGGANCAQTIAGSDLTATDSDGVKQEHSYKYSGSNRYELVSNPFRAATSAAAASGGTPEPTMGWTMTTFDQRGRITSVGYYDASKPAMFGGTSSSLGETSTTWDSENESVKDPAGVSRTQTRDGLGRLLSVTEDSLSVLAGKAVTCYAWDALDDLSSVAQTTDVANCSSAAAQRTFSYTSLGRLQSANNPESGTNSWTYDDDGNITSKKDGSSRTVCFGTWSGATCDGAGYDQLNRLVKKTYSDGTTPMVTFSYDSSNAPYSVGRLTSVTAAAVTISGGSTIPAVTRTITGYDYSGRVSGVMQQVGTNPSRVMGHGWYLSGAPYTATLPSGRLLKYSVDGVNHLTDVYGTAAPVGSPQIHYGNAAYAPHGAVSTLSLYNGISEATTFNARLQPVSITAGTTQSPGLWSASLYYCDGKIPRCTTNNGNIREQDITAQGKGFATTYDYDGANRLCAAIEGATNPITIAPRCQAPQSGGNWWQTYLYDRQGNRALLAGSFGTAGNSQAQVPTITSSPPFYANNQWTAAGYDAAGNTTTLYSGGPQLAYDSENRVTSVSESTMPAISYVYDGEGRRVLKTIGSATIEYVYDGTGELVAEYGNASSVSGPLYNTADWLGSTRMVSNAAGAPVEFRDYAPFGEEIGPGVGARPASAVSQLYVAPAYPSVTPDVNKVNFTGKERDSETGLDFFGARYFSAAQGRFTSPDWSEKPEPVPYSDLTDPQSLNLYAYVRNNPLKNRDLDGHVCVFGIGNTCTPDPLLPPPPHPAPPPLPKDVPYTNLPGPQYKSVDQAGKVAVATINPKSIEENKEYAGRVVLNVNGTYGTTDPKKGTEAGSNPGAVPDGTIGAGVYHTHAAFDPRYDNENFSPQDKRSAGREGTPSFLGTPAGAIKKYDPATGRIIILRKPEGER